jgi:hypothetical protein
MFWLTGILGLVLILAPFVLGYQNDPTALWTSVICGAAVVVVSGYKAWAHDKAIWEYWVAGIAGVLAVLAPFALGFSALVTAMWTSIVIGAVVAVLAGYEVFFMQPASS